MAIVKVSGHCRSTSYVALHEACAGAVRAPRGAQALGLVSKVVPEGELEGATERLLGTLRSRTREAIVAVKDYQRAAPELGARSGRDLAANLLASALSSRAR
ncbi:MAG TPA: hypothetical protein VGN91_02790 [Bosea sp. (in: a-proteobacteria)]|nr:hypothetical protein [Bosea sp. (in: a-proteobacteria)]